MIKRGINVKKFIYHGSESIVKNPCLEEISIGKDFGTGFYVSENLELAREWACKNGNDGFVNGYSCDMTDLKVLNLTNMKKGILFWLSLMCANRTLWTKTSIGEEAKRFLAMEYPVNKADYDVIIAYRGDDSYTDYARAFLMGEISLQRLNKFLKLGRNEEEIVLVSQKAIDSLVYLGNDMALSSAYYVKKVNRDLEAREKMKKFTLKKGTQEIYIKDIMEGRVSEDALCL